MIEHALHLSTLYWCTMAALVVGTVVAVVLFLARWEAE